LRISYYWESLKPITSTYGQVSKKTFYKKLLQTIKNLFYGFDSWFKPYDYLVFSDIEIKDKIDEQYIDKSFEKIIEIIGYEKTLYIESTKSEHFPKNEVMTPNIVSNSPIQVIILVLSKFTNFFNRQKITIEDLSNIKENTGLNINYNHIIKKFNISVTIYKLLFKIYKPKAIFVNCYYIRIPVIKAANCLGIKTIEMQHGKIGHSHLAYNIHTYVDKSFYPDILLTFGEHDKKILEDNPYNPFDKIVAVGAYSLELIENRPIAKDLLKITKKYKHTISVSTQYTVEEKLAIFFRDIARDNKSIAFLLSLRHYDKNYYDKFKMPDNVYLFKGEYSCYDILKACDMHLTSYSTCAIEALSFQKKSILMDIDGLASSSFGYIKSYNLHIISTQSEFNTIVKSRFKKEENKFYKSNYTENINNFIKEEILSI